MPPHRTLPLALAFSFLLPALAAAAPKPDLWPRWAAHTAQSTRRVDHSLWDRFLKKYVVSPHPSGVNRVRYASVAVEDRRALRTYVQSLERVPVSELSRAEQKAFWINLYNALTVEVVLDHYPLKSIRDIRSGWLSPGPWDLKLATVDGIEVTLNDIEHRILRPIFRDNRIHYAVNCASLGCPNLQPEAYTSENTDRLLEKGATEYVNHPRGAHLEGEKLVLSSLYDWYRADFGGSKPGVLRHLERYAAPPLAGALKAFRGSVSYAYDWTLNE